MKRTLRAPTALLENGWAEDVLFETDAAGLLVRVEPGAPAGPDEERVEGVLLPGIPDLHSHAFQRGMAGGAEGAGRPGDTFWEWRERMYAFLGALGPDEVEAVATRLYVEMLRAGYTAVGEFHYLHHAPGGRRYDDPAELSLRIVRAAGRTGIALTHLPVLYRTGGFGGEPLSGGQERFGCGVEELVRIGERTAGAMVEEPGTQRLGLALHSLRAVPPDEVGPALDAWGGAFGEGPVHVHAAEQSREVEACLEATGARPVEWLLENAPVDASWCVVHATHMSEAETEGLARSGAVAGLCPTTEANLGDGLFPLPRWLEAGGALGVGSDSHVSVDPVEELRWLEYGQRLTLRRRGVAAAAARGAPADAAGAARGAPADAAGAARGAPGPEAASTGRVLVETAVAGGARALGQPAGPLRPGRRLDAVVLDPDHPVLAGRTGDRLLDAWIFSGNERLVRHVMVGGRWVVRDGRHPLDEESARDFRDALERAGPG